MEETRRVCDRRVSVQRGVVWVMLIECHHATGMAVGRVTSLL